MLFRFYTSHVCRLPSSIALQSTRHLTFTSLKNARGFRNSNFSEQFSFKSKTILTGKSLRERLLGPTTGKPFIYGTYAIAGASLAGVGMLCYYGLGMSKEINAVDRST